MDLISAVCGWKHCMGLFPRMSKSTHALSSCPETNKRPEGSTHTEATGEPNVDPCSVIGAIVFTHSLDRKSQNRTVLS